MKSQDIAQLSINTIRTLSMDAVQKASSGHPGTPMALAPVMYTVWQDFLRYDPDRPIWPNRDRFVLSVGHASMLLYSMLHLTGVKSVNRKYECLDEPSVSLDEIKHFRQWDSRTPGHPEYRMVSGVETTTGPLGQGVANSVGMAIAQRWLAERYNRPDFEIFDYSVYVLCSDGDLMEGVAQETASLAGHLGLGNLCWIYDNNHISIEGNTDLAFSENVGARFQALGWSVEHVRDANDLGALRAALGKRQSDRPLLVIVDSVIAWGAPNKHGKASAHGEPLGEEEIRLAKRAYGWPEDAQFLVPDEVRAHFREGMAKRGHEQRLEWDRLFDAYSRAHPDLAREIDQMQRRQLPEGWDKDLPQFPADAKGKATRETSGQVLNAIAKRLPWLMGGSADLSPSTKTDLKFEGAGTFGPKSSGRNLHFGVREHGMGSILNGLSLSKIRPYGSTFLIFSDYERPAIRLSSIMELPVIHIFTHDSVGLGEDGPTHQPIEQLPSLRAVPGLIVLRPADANEVVEAWRTIIPLRDQPVALCLTRQAVPTLDRSKLASAAGLSRGAYTLLDAEGGKPQVILMATGSEVQLALKAHEVLQKEGIRARVVSMPSWELFERQDESYRDSVLPPEIEARVSIELGSTFGWERYVGRRGVAVGMRSFGASAPLKDLLTRFGFTVDDVVAAAKRSLGNGDKR